MSKASEERKRWDTHTHTHVHAYKRLERKKNERDQFSLGRKLICRRTYAAAQLDMAG